MKVIVNGRGAELRNGAHRGIGENEWRVENGRGVPPCRRRGRKTAGKRTPESLRKLRPAAAPIGGRRLSQPHVPSFRASSRLAAWLSNWHAGVLSRTVPSRSFDSSLSFFPSRSLLLSRNLSLSLSLSLSFFAFYSRVSIPL